jgi:hypothetical protein
VTNDKANHRRRRGVWLGLLMVLLLALAGYGYAVTSSPSASTGPDKGKPSASPSPVVLAPAAPNGNGNGNGGGGTGGGTDNCVDPSSEAGNCDHRFGVTVGQAQTLYPGLNRTLPVTYVNPNNFDIFINTYRVSVSVPAAKAALCPASSLLVPSGTVTVNPNLKAPKNGSISTTIPIKLAASAPDGCQQVTFTITVNASAVKK